MNYAIGEKVEFEKETRTLTGTITNTNGEVVYLWQARKGVEGACIPNLWEEWKRGDSKGRRSI